jgi:putative membrane protein
MAKFKLPKLTFQTRTLGFALLSGAVFGLALFLGIADIGAQRIWDEVTGVGLGLLAIVFVHVAQLAFCGSAWSALLREARSERGVPYSRLLFLRWIRESIDSLLPVAQIGGEVAAARILARRGMPLPSAGASIIADVTIETLTQAVFTLIGLALVFMLAEPGDVAHWAALGLVVAVVFAALAVFAQRWGGVRLFERLLLAIADRTGWNKLEGVAGLDDALSRVYTLRGRLLLAGMHHLMAWSLGAFEIMVAAWALGYHLDLGQSYVVESLAQAIRSAAFFVPGALGVQEGGIVVLGQLFGVPPDIAISISLTKRVRELALGLPGLAAWQYEEWRLRRARRVAATGAGRDQGVSLSTKGL